MAGIKSRWGRRRVMGDGGRATANGFRRRVRPRRTVRRVRSQRDCFTPLYISRRHEMNRYTARDFRSRNNNNNPTLAETTLALRLANSDLAIIEGTSLSLSLWNAIDDMTCYRAFALSVLVLSMVVDWATTVQAETSPLRREFYGPSNPEFFAEFLDGHARNHRRDNGLGFASGSRTYLDDDDDDNNDNDNDDNAVNEWPASSKSIALLPADREFLERFVKRNIDEIDRTAFDNFFKRNLDEMGRVGWNGFVKRLADYLATNGGRRNDNVLARRG